MRWLVVLEIWLVLSIPVTIATGQYLRWRGNERRFRRFEILGPKPRDLYVANLDRDFCRNVALSHDGLWRFAGVRSKEDGR
jgi:hypothetical protein